ncbi:hypothetical protein [Flavobacterium sp.]
MDTLITRVYLKENCKFQNVIEAKVTLEAIGKKTFRAVYDKKGKFYYFDSIPKGYTTIFVEHDQYETDGYLIDEDSPKRIDFNLDCKGNIRQYEIKTNQYKDKGYPTDNYYYYKNDTIFNNEYVFRDNYKLLISFPNSYSLPYKDIIKKLDSIVKPYGLEFIDDLVPEAIFAKLELGEKSAPYHIDQTKSLKDLASDRNSIIYRIMDYGSTYYPIEDFLQSIYYFRLPYRKTDKSAFRGDFDLLLTKLKEEHPEINAELLYANKFFIDTDVKIKISCAELSRYDDKIMNYQFLPDYENDKSRLLFLDPGFGEYVYSRVFIGKYGLDQTWDGEVVYDPQRRTNQSNFRYKRILQKKEEQ